MSSKIAFLRDQAAAYLRSASTTDDRQAAARLVMLAALCQERILDLQRLQTATPEPAA